MFCQSAARSPSDLVTKNLQTSPSIVTKLYYVYWDFQSSASLIIRYVGKIFRFHENKVQD